MRARTRPHPALYVVALLVCGASFDLGVGAFEVGPRSAILWTRAAPGPEEATSQRVILELAADPGFQTLVREKVVRARARHDFTLRTRISGLEPATRYWYRFVAVEGNVVFDSRVGSFLTAPDPSQPAPLRFVVSGDSNYGFTRRNGLDFYVLSAAAAEQPDFFVYYGDTVYADSGILPSGADAVTLDEYRLVHRLTRSDPHLQELLATTGTFSGWDDHEVRNDYDGETVEPERFAAGARAFFEYLPLRPSPGTRRFRTDRTVRWGSDVELFFLDGRQFRSAERFCNASSPDGPEAPDTLFSPFAEDEDIVAQVLPPDLLEAASALLLPSDPECAQQVLGAPGRSLLGRAQLARLKRQLLASDATFKILVNDVPISSLLFFPYDRWEGYLAERQDLLDFVAANLDPGRVFVLTTDFHTNLAVRRPELTELIVGPIGQSTFGSSVVSMLPPELQSFAFVILLLLDQVFDIANGGGGAVLGSAHDAFSYAVVEVFRDTNDAPHLRATVRGDPGWAAGANDPGSVVDLFSFELP
jgi:phosphodiesterase/alkaline phosphatase D-like protein